MWLSKCDRDLTVRFPDGGEVRLHEVRADDLYPVSHNGNLDLPVSAASQPYYPGMRVGSDAKFWKKGFWHQGAFKKAQKKKGVIVKVATSKVWVSPVASTGGMPVDSRTMMECVPGPDLQLLDLHSAVDWQVGEKAYYTRYSYTILYSYAILIHCRWARRRTCLIYRGAYPSLGLMDLARVQSQVGPWRVSLGRLAILLRPTI
jgi:hypothetical protein